MEDRQSLDQQVEVTYRRLRELLERSGASPETLEELRRAGGELEAQAQEEAAERRATQAALAAERTFASTVLDTVGALVIVLDREGRIVRFNRMCEQATGYAFEEVKGRCFWDFLLLPEEVSPVRAAFDDLRAGRFPNQFENIWVARDGSRILIAWTNTAIPGPDSSPEYVIGTGLDITQRRHVEEELRSLARFPAENPNPVIRLDLAGTLLYANEASAALLGEWGCQVGDPIPPTYRNLVADAFADEASRKVWVPSGERVYSFDIVPFTEAGYVNLYGRDVTARVRAESQREAALEALRQSEERFRTVANFTYDWEYWVGVDGRYLYVSPSCERITGYRADEFMQNSGLLETIIHPDDRATVGRHLKEQFESNEAMALDFRILTRAGEERWISHICTPVYGTGGHPLGRRASNRDITERVRAEAQREAALEELRETRDYLDNLLTYANAPIIVWDPDFKITRFNGAFERLTGLKTADVLGRELDVLFPEERTEEAMAHIRRAVAGERWETVEIPIRRIDGTVRTVLWNSATLYAVDGMTAVATIAQGQDITERVQAEEERERLLKQAQRDRESIASLAQILQQEWDTLQAIMESTHAQLAYLDPDFNFVRVNSAYAQGSGHSREELIGHNHFDLFANAENQAIFEQVRATGQPAAFHTKPFEFADQPERGVTYWNWTLVPVKEGDGQVRGLVLSLLDVTDQVLSRRVVEELAARDEAILNSLTEGVITLDPAGKILAINPAALRILGFEGIEHARRRFKESPNSFEARDLNGDVMPVESSPQARLMRGETFSDYELQVRDLVTGAAWVGSFSGAPVRDAAGDLAMGVLAVHDITVEKQAQAQRDATLEELKAALAEKEVLMREIYHRVKNNVQALIYLMDMQAEYIPDEDTQQMIRELQERARAMALVHEKLYQSQNLAQIDFGDYLYDLVDNLSHAFGTDRPIVWHLDVEDVPLGVDTAIPCGLIVSELLTNALKYAFPGGEPRTERGETECTISVASHIKEDLITLVVADNGVGLPAGVDWATTKTLGLQLINILARHQLGGQVEVDRHAGTTFTITFTDRERKKA